LKLSSAFAQAADDAAVLSTGRNHKRLHITISPGFLATLGMTGNAEWLHKKFSNWIDINRFWPADDMLVQPGLQLIYGIMRFQRLVVNLDNQRPFQGRRKQRRDMNLSGYIHAVTPIIFSIARNTQHLI